jgi:4a-hydroxytetrahydrobiopterin dehydratase
MALNDEKCVPCRGNVEPLTRAEAETLAAGLPGWTLDEDAASIARKFRFGDFASALAFVQRVGAVAEAEGHHPDIAFGWGYCTVTFRTHKIRGLHRNDFIMAARVDEVAGRGEGR